MTEAPPIAAAATPRCIRHPEDPEADDCDRCGAFACDACLKHFEHKYLCVDCVGRELAALPQLESRAGPAKVLLIICAAFDVLGFLTRSSGPIEGLGNFAYLVSGVLFLRWYSLAVSHANRLDVGPGATPSAAMLAWFLPVVSWFRPYDQTRLMLRQLNRPTGLVDVLQVSFVLSGILALAVLRARNDLMVLVYLVVDFIAALAARKVVLLLTSALDERRTAHLAPPVAGAERSVP